jgi:hypothetical protein
MGAGVPVMPVHLRTGNGSWIAAPFLVDTGADRTVVSAGVLATLQLPHLITAERLRGVGGAVMSVLVDTQLRLLQEDRSPVTVRGPYAAFTDPEALDMSVLGRDITGLFAVIVDEPEQVVCLLRQRHRYHIETL